MRILLVEDDRTLAGNLSEQLSEDGYAVDHAADGIEGDYLGREVPYDLVILDLGLPGRAGLEILTGWRREDLDFPVLVLTARDAWSEKVEGFRAGADDYLGKPFRYEELAARVQALIRRSHGRSSGALHSGGLRLDEQTQRAEFDDGRSVELTGTEFRLLRCFLLNPDRILSKTRLTEHVYGQDFDRDSNLIEVYIRRLREKLGSERIETRRGQGYVWPSATD